MLQNFRAQIKYLFHGQTLLESWKLMFIMREPLENLRRPIIRAPSETHYGVYGSNIVIRDHVFRLFTTFQHFIIFYFLSIIYIPPPCISCLHLSADLSFLFLVSSTKQNTAVNINIRILQQACTFRRNLTLCSIYRKELSLCHKLKFSNTYFIFAT